MSIPAYLILGSPTCGRRGIALDVIEKALNDTDFCCVFVSANEKLSDFDKRIAGLHNAGIVKYSSSVDAAEKLAALDENKITHVIFVADSSQNLADAVEEFKWIVDQGTIHLARIWSVLDCAAFVESPNDVRPYFDALSHFADCLLLSRRNGISNKEVIDIKQRYEKMCQPHLIEFVDKNFQVANPIELLIDEARRITMIFDEFDAVDDIELDEDNLPEEPFSLERKPDPYLVRMQNLMRQKPIPDISKFAFAAREKEKSQNEKL